MTIEALKEQARRHEQKEEWAKALDQYLKAIERLQADEQADIGLYNRVGDLQTRIGNVEAAVLHYEQAVELYIEAELPNNAIAICKKILRNLPQRGAVFLKMGQIRASQGFLKDARHNFLAYAELMQKEGDMEEAFRALIEFADLAPEDLDMRMAVASQLESHESHREAVEQYKLAYQGYRAAGHEDEAEAVSEKIRELDPDAELPEEMPAALVAEDDEELADFDLAAGYSEESEFDTAGEFEGSEDFGGADGFETSSEFEAPSEFETPTEIDAGSGFETTTEFSGEGELAPAGGLAGEDDLEAASGFEATDEGPAEEVAGWGDGDGTGDPGWSDGVPAEDGPDAGWGDEEEEGELPPLPLLALDDDDAEKEEDSSDLGEPESGGLQTPDLDDMDEVTIAAAVEEVAGEGEMDALPLLEDVAEPTEEAAEFAKEEREFIEEGAELAEAEAELTEEEVELAGVAAESTEQEAELTEEEVEFAGVAAESTEADGESAAELDSDSAVAAAVEEAWEEAVSAPDDPVASLRARVDENPTDNEAWRLLGEGLIGRGDSSDGVAALERAHQGFAGEERLDQAMRVVRELVLHEPDEVPHHQRLVEYAHRMGDRTLLIPAYQDLAECLVRTGEASKAQAVYQQVIAVDPGNRRASDGLQRLETGFQPAASSAVSSDYVDLGSMVLDEGKERSTRWTVAADAPSGDEEADFAKMLSQFKAKVAENLSSDDDKAHYDLGTAYKEMGLQDEAIGEFQQAIRANPNSLASYEMLGQCFLDKSQADIAVRSLEKALELPYAVEDELLGIYYYLGRAHEDSGNSESAQEFYEKVFALDINFQDVTERLRALR